MPSGAAPYFYLMISREALLTLYADLTKMIIEVDLAQELEDDDEILQDQLKQCVGQLKAARRWIVNIRKEKGWI